MKHSEKFKFVFPLTRTDIDFQVNKFGFLTIVYTGYHDEKNVGEDYEYDVDLENILTPEGFDIRPIIESDQFQDLFERLTEAAMQDCQDQYYELYQANREYRALTRSEETFPSQAWTEGVKRN